MHYNIIIRKPYNFLCGSCLCDILDSLPFLPYPSSFAVCLGPSLQLTDTQDCLAIKGAHGGFPHGQYGAQEHTGPAQGSCDEATAGHGQ